MVCNFILHGQYGHSPHTDEGVEARRVFHKLRSIAMENFHEHFKGIFDGQLCLAYAKPGSHLSQKGQFDPLY